MTLHGAEPARTVDARKRESVCVHFSACILRLQANNQSFGHMSNLSCVFIDSSTLTTFMTIPRLPNLSGQ